MTQKNDSTDIAVLRAGNAGAESSQLQLVTFRVGEEQFAVDILAVQEINRMIQITRAPQSPPGVEGVINLRGRLVPVMDLRQRFGLEVRELTGSSRIVVVDVDSRTIGFIVDRVDEVLRIDRSVVDPAPADVTGVDSRYIQGIGKLDDRLILLLDIQKLFRLEDLENLDHAVSEAA